MPSKIVVIVAKYVRGDGSLEIGGIETYVSQLARAFSKTYDFSVYQRAANASIYHFDDVKVVALELENFQMLVDYVEKNILTANDILIISTEQLNVFTKWHRTLVIQHGIYWDLAVKQYTSNNLARLLPNIYKLMDNFRNYQRIKNYNNVVCVDYAYSNWMRTFIGDYAKNTNFTVIPNHADDVFFLIDPPCEKEPISILFARRFMRFRGTSEFANVAQKILQHYPSVQVTLCGDGPELKQMQRILPPSASVNYIRASHDEMPEIIARHNIIVVPSLGSEGTSLSAIEGMAAGRAVVASAVGGLTNIVLDGYNGLLVQPANEDDLFRALEKLINDPALRRTLGEQARAIAKEQLSFANWSIKWNAAINETAK